MSTTSVVLWAATVEGQSLTAEVSYDDFATVAKTKTVQPCAEDDYTANVLISDLEPGRPFRYRFSSESAEEPIYGNSRPLPVDPTKVTIAFYSCVNYAAGHFGAFGQMADDPDIDLVVSLGDNIYEYGKEKTVRTFASYEFESPVPERIDQLPATEPLTLPEYRAMHKLSLSDPNYQKMRAKKPVLVLWDDHDLLNNWHATGDQYQVHDPDTQGPFADRVAAAKKAFFELYPNVSVSIDKTLVIGNLAVLKSVDNRSNRSPQVGAEQMAYYHAVASRDQAAIEAAKAAYETALNDPDRQMITDAQKAEISAAVDQALAKNAWLVFLSQGQVSEDLRPLSLQHQTALAFASGLERQIVAALVRELTYTSVYLAGGRDATDDDVDAAGLGAINAILTQFGMPLVSAAAAKAIYVEANESPKIEPFLDHWAGYPDDRKFLVSELERAPRAVVLTGDTHKGGVAQIMSDDGEYVATELLTQAVTALSDGDVGSIQLFAQMGAPFNKLEVALADARKQAESFKKGYSKATITADKVVGTQVYVDQRNANVATKEEVAVVEARPDGYQLLSASHPGN